MAWQAPLSSTCKFDNLTRRMKQEGDGHLKGQTRVGLIHLCMLQYHNSKMVT
jgi:hypothetical protein